MTSAMASTAARTLELREDQQVLRGCGEAGPGGLDVQRLRPEDGRGDVRQMSFAFTVGDDSWDIDGGHRPGACGPQGPSRVGPVRCVGRRAGSLPADRRVLRSVLEALLSLVACRCWRGPPRRTRGHQPGRLVSIRRNCVGGEQLARLRALARARAPRSSTIGHEECRHDFEELRAAEARANQGGSGCRRDVIDALVMTRRVRDIRTRPQRAFDAAVGEAVARRRHVSVPTRSGEARAAFPADPGARRRGAPHRPGRDRVTATESTYRPDGGALVFP